MSYWKFIKRFRFNIACILWELQRPDFIWDSKILSFMAYNLHDLLCPEMWMIRVFPNYLKFVGEPKNEP